MPTLYTPSVWSSGDWTTETADNSLIRFAGTTSTKWGLLTWSEENTNDETKAYVRVDILKASDNSILASNLQRSTVHGGIDLADYPDIGTNNIKVKFKLYGKELSPVVSNVLLRTFEEW